MMTLLVVGWVRCSLIEVLVVVFVIVAFGPTLEDKTACTA
jgi:hypothetical protein